MKFVAMYEGFRWGIDPFPEWFLKYEPKLSVKDLSSIEKAKELDPDIEKGTVILLYIHDRGHKEVLVDRINRYGRVKDEV